jgi:hypothetical protein
MPHCGKASGVFSIFTVRAGRVSAVPEGSGRPVRGDVGGGVVVVVVVLVVVVGDADLWKCTMENAATAITMTTTRPMRKLRIK